MILKHKDISDATALKMVSTLLRKQQSSKGFKVNTRKGTRTVTYDELIKFVDVLAKRLDSGRYCEVHRCTTCGNFNRSGKTNKRGWCFPQEHTSTRLSTDYCSRWVPMTEQQKHIKERMDEHFESLQTK